MIISASRRTDIPAFYSDWFFRRLREGYVLVRNPMNPHRISRVSLTADVVDGIVLWTKNPIPMLERLEKLEPFPYYVQFTLTPYGREVEPGLPSKEDVLLPAFQRLSRQAGRERVIWRYDPIFFNDTWTPERHREVFARMAERLGEYTELCTVSFLDRYRNSFHRMRPLGVWEETEKQRRVLMEQFARTAKKCGFSLATCAEEADYGELGITHAHCVDKRRLERIAGDSLSVEKDKNQRPACGCDASIDIGMYASCRNGCRYCYANSSDAAAARNSAAHDPASPLLFGSVGEEDVVTERRMRSCKDLQMSLTDLLAFDEAREGAEASRRPGRERFLHEVRKEG